MTMEKFATRIKPMINNYRYGKYSFYTIDDLVKYSRKWIKKFDKCYDAYVGIPRSGLFVANVLGMMTGRPVFTPSMLVNDENPYFRGGKGYNLDDILLVDDSLATGNTLKNVSKGLDDAGIRFDTGVVFVKKGMEQEVDHWFVKTGQHRIFEWNMMHVKWYRVGFDLDGVLCHNCPRHIAEDKKLYGEWLLNAVPFHIPSYRIDFILSNRLEVYRDVTEEWLDRHGVMYDRLMLWDTKWDDRRGNYHRHKLKMVYDSGVDVLFESNRFQAGFVHYEAGIPVVCIDTLEALC